MAMLARVLSAAVNGVESFPVEVEVNSGWGDTVVVIVGLPAAAVEESRDRFSTALSNSRFKWFHEFDLDSIEDFEVSSLIVENNRLAIRADHQIIGVGHNE
jgi:hypothetical protein